MGDILRHEEAEGFRIGGRFRSRGILVQQARCMGGVCICEDVAVSKGVLEYAAEKPFTAV